jgi:diguanylate cyclase (GGDEF)-like protein/PAS domain S-box-containing protein
LRFDIQRREIAESGLQLYENIFRHSGEASLITNSDNRIIAVNPAFSQLTGYVLDDVLGHNPSLLSSGKTPPETYLEMWDALTAGGHWQGELSDRRKDGTVYPKWAAISAIRDDAGRTTHYIASFSDISERKAAEARIERLAHHDALTGLLNRYSLQNRLEQGLNTARRENHWLAVLFIDMDRFKSINDTLGHHIGDRLLQEVARRLQEGVRESDIVARQGGDEFVVVLTGLMDVHDSAPVTNKLLRSLGDVYDIEGHSLHSSPSIGVSIFPDDGDSADVLLKNADAAMYHAKDKGRNNIQYFTATMTAVALERMEVEHDLHSALANREFELFYQPQIRARDRTIFGVEALIRWRHPQRGLVPPDRFIPIAEDAGLIESIGVWVLDEACRQLAEWRKAGISGIRMAVNLSAHQLRSPHLALLVSQCITRHHIEDGELELEITESAAMENPERAIGQLRGLRDLGVHLAIDDFGTGYSSLAYLKHLPIQTLKLDRSFVRDIETDANDAAISAATIALAHTLGLQVVAEGVETQTQADFLTITHGCDILQGYLFGRPEPAAKVIEHLRRP